MGDTRRLPAPAPRVRPETKVFWDATAEGRFLLPTCVDCSTAVWYPRPYCPECGSLRVRWVEASRRGTIYSFTINRLGHANLPDYRGAGEYVLAYVELDEGPRVLTNIVDCEVASLEIGQQVEAVFHDTGAQSSLIRFRPVSVPRPPLPDEIGGSRSSEDR